jgi:hypothetical protein
MLPKTSASAAPTKPKKGAYSGQYGEPMSSGLRRHQRGNTSGQHSTGRSCISGSILDEGVRISQSGQTAAPPGPPNTCGPEDRRPTPSSGRPAPALLAPPLIPWGARRIVAHAGEVGQAQCWRAGQHETTPLGLA